MPNCIGSEGAAHLANALVEHNTLLQLDMTHNGICQQGVAAFRQVLRSLDGRSRNLKLVRLDLEQYGIPHNELDREAIRATLRENYAALSISERACVDEAITPSFLADIASVYRVEASYPTVAELPPSGYVSVLPVLPACRMLLVKARDNPTHPYSP